MRFLFVHQNFPGQFRHVAPALAENPAHQVVALGDVTNLRSRPPLHPKVRQAGYAPHGGAGAETHPYLRELESHVRRGQSVARAALELKEQGFVPDVVVAHPGWGEALYLREVFGQARHIHYCEFYYRSEGADVGFDPEFPINLDGQCRVRTKNATQLLSLSGCDAGISPTAWQREGYPAEQQGKISVMHEGVDTQTIRPNANALFEHGTLRLRPGDEVVTYVSRNLEPYRGIHSFLRALPELQARRPQAQVVIVGGDEVSYGVRLPPGESYRARYCAELGERVDWSRVHFTGRLPYAAYLSLLQVSAAHVYLTYPFVLSWSLVEAMAAGCAIVASDTAPVREALVHGQSAQLVDFFDVQALAQAVAEVLEDPASTQPMRAAARAHAVQHFDLHSVCLPRLRDFLSA